MPCFGDIHPFQNSLRGLFVKLTSDPVINEKAPASKLLFRFNYSDPAGEVRTDRRG